MKWTNKQTPETLKHVKSRPSGCIWLVDAFPWGF